MPLARLAALRESTYRLLSQAFMYPDDLRLSSLATTARELRRKGRALVRFAFFSDWTRVLRFLERTCREDPQSLKAPFAPLFVIRPGGVPCPPYESVYRGANDRPPAEVLTQVEREYAAAGLGTSPDLGDLPDHITVELEFMAVLCGREAQAWDAGEPSQAAEALRRQRDFLDAHLGAWLPEFARRVATTDAGGAYPVLAQGTATLARYDRDLVDLLLENAPATAEGP